MLYTPYGNIWGISMKECFKCGLVKPLSEYYKHKRMADGHLNKCKECAKTDVKKNRAENVDYYREYDTWRYANQPQVRERHKRYASTKEGKDAIRRSIKSYINRNPEARAAHIIVGNAVRSGRLHKPVKCPICLEFKPARQIHAHHDDYAKPLEVRWMCAMCHTKEHDRQNPFND